MRRVFASIVLVLGSLVFGAAPLAADAGEAANADLRTPMAKIASGLGYSCRVLDTGHVACWGKNTSGQLGNGSASTSTTIPVLVSGISTATAVSIGSIHACALLADTTVKCWGRGEHGRLGDGATTNRSEPVTVYTSGTTPLTGVSALALGYQSSCALLAVGTVSCWGDNNSWQLGSDPSATVTSSSFARTVPDLSGAKAIASGNMHVCVVMSDDTPQCWGLGSSGQLGNGSFSNAAPTPVTLAGVTTVKAIVGGYGHTCVIKKADDVVGCWGSNWDGETGAGSGTMYELTLVTPQIGTNNVTAKAISISASNTCVVTLGDEIACWGRYMDGGSKRPTGFGSTAFAREVLTGSNGTTAVAVGDRHGCATFTGGTMKCWGLNEYASGDGAGALANSSTVSSPTAFVSSLNAAVSSITFTDPGSKTTADTTFSVVASSSSGVAVDLGVDTPDVCTISGTTITIVAHGTCTINAGQAELTVSNTKWFKPASVTRNVTIGIAPPTASTGTASDIRNTSATVSGGVRASLASTTVSFEYSTSAAFSSATSVSGGSVTGGSLNAVTGALTNLAPGTKYWFRVKAVNSAGTTTGNAESFTTRGTGPTASTGSTSSVSSTRATLNGVVNPGEADTEVWFTIGKKSDLSDGTRIDYRSLSGGTDTDVSVTATGLVESTRYYFRLEAKNSLGSAKGDIKSFTASRPLGITINDAAEFTNSRKVTIYATGPSGATQVILSNDGGFGASQTFDLTDGYAEISWTLVASRDERLPKTVYARFVQRFGSQSSTNTDDIILDTTAPTMTSASGASTGSSPSGVAVQSVVAAAAKGGVRLTVRAKDANSGIGTVQVKTSSRGGITAVPTSNPKASSRTLRLNTTKKRLWVRVVDRAGNVSRWVTISVK